VRGGVSRGCRHGRRARALCRKCWLLAIGPGELIVREISNKGTGSGVRRGFLASAGACAIVVGPGIARCRPSMGPRTTGRESSRAIGAGKVSRRGDCRRQQRDGV
jgi:hypothetical protein